MDLWIYYDITICGVDWFQRQPIQSILVASCMSQPMTSCDNIETVRAWGLGGVRLYAIKYFSVFIQRPNTVGAMIQLAVPGRSVLIMTQDSQNLLTSRTGLDLDQ